MRSCLFCNTVLDIEEDTHGTPQTWDYPGDPPGFTASCPRCDATLELEEDGHYVDNNDDALVWTATGKSIVALAKRMATAFDHVPAADVKDILPDLFEIVEQAETDKKRAERLVETAEKLNKLSRGAA